VITGRLRRRGTFAVAGSGLVDVIILGPDGTVIDEGSTRYVPRLIRKGHSSTFTMRFPVVAPKGTVVRVAHHPRLYNHPKNGSCARRNSTTHWAAYTCAKASIHLPGVPAFFAQVYHPRSTAESRIKEAARAPPVFDGSTPATKTDRLHTVRPQFVDKVAAADTQQFRGLSLVAAGLFERF